MYCQPKEGACFLMAFTSDSGIGCTAYMVRSASNSLAGSNAAAGRFLSMKQLLNGNECKQQCFEIQDRLAQMLQ
jgi:hypothetical protein